MRRFCEVALFLVAGCSGTGAADSPQTTTRHCDLAPLLERRAGLDPTDCGHAPVPDDVGKVDACVVAAFQAGRAFVAEYARVGTDSEVTAGIAGDATGVVTFLLRDGDPSGGSMTGAVAWASICSTPSVDLSPTRDPLRDPPLSCASTVSSNKICE